MRSQQTNGDKENPMSVNNFEIGTVRVGAASNVNNGHHGIDRVDHIRGSSDKELSNSIQLEMF